MSQAGPLLRPQTLSPFSTCSFDKLDINYWVPFSFGEAQHTIHPTSNVKQPGYNKALDIIADPTLWLEASSAKITPSG
jgi:hypothetical protein